MVKKQIPAQDAVSPLFIELNHLILQTKQRIARNINSNLVLLNWRVGERIRREILKNRRGEYGEQIVSYLAAQLTLAHGPGFSRANLFHMIRFVEVFPEVEIVSAVRRQLSWTHFKLLIYIENPIKRDFYLQLCQLEGWSTRALEQKIQGLLYERTAISRKPEELIKQELKKLREGAPLTPDFVFRDPYFLDFLHLPHQYSETQLENAILNELCVFLQEMGTEFCFIARQKRITIDNEDFYIDLLLYHRGLKRLIAIELKLGKFTAGHKGQMELYLRWLDKYERKEGEEKPLGLILCSEKKQEHIELLELGNSGIHVAEYLTKLPPFEVLEAKLQKAISIARERISQQKALSISKEIDT